MANTKKSIQNLLDSKSPQEWKDWLFHIQITLIDKGYCEGLTKAGSADFASDMAALYNFFSDLQPAPVPSKEIA